MREFILLPVVAAATLVGAVIMITVLLVLVPLLTYFERKGTLRLGHLRRNRHLADFDHNPV